jgi:hypothetical protein
VTEPFALFDLEALAPQVSAALRAESPGRPLQGPLPHERRIVADSGDRVAWLRARSRGITATDAAKLATRESVRSAAYEKLHGTRRSFGGSRYTDHGREREPVIAEWVRRTHGIAPSTLLFHAEGEDRHLATPDGLAADRHGRLELCEIKTTSKPWRSIPRPYLRQVWWQQYVLGAERTLVVWEQHDEFVPVEAEPRCRWVDRDDDQIQRLVTLAGELLEAIGPRAPLPPPPERDRSFYRPGALA